MDTQSPDAIAAFKNLSAGKKILVGILFVLGIWFVVYMNLAQQTREKEAMITYYQDYTKQTQAIVSKIENPMINGTTRKSRWDTFITFTTINGEEITTTLSTNNFVAPKESVIEILYDPSYPHNVVTVEEYQRLTGKSVN